MAPLKPRHREPREGTVASTASVVRARRHSTALPQPVIIDYNIIPYIHTYRGFSDFLLTSKAMAHNNKAYEPQEFQPADPDPYRLYWLPETNGHWTLYPRRQVDRLNARWYRSDEGAFYAVRLTD
ncbi:uncharacterized protein B0T15DRAFT_540748 [Chaetomium strumarium]|uniref:Uncharacterized protein n=1 Tax=Chaetomium strumarium TaxID=1170767 RepID=A0AAJ0GP56_9PEZI|nr:hypothetical protein B0T15DRAFT_540748 [Chaetomium strumarium]